MNPELKEKWIKELRSGRHIQAKKVLHNAKTQAKCCLGVLCEVAGFAKEIKEENVYSEEFGQDVTLVVYEYEFPDGTVETRELSKNFTIETFKNRCGCVIIPKLYDRTENTPSLVGLNDEGFTFDQIADIIEYFF